MLSVEEIREKLESIPDPEVPVLTIMDLGIVRDIRIQDKNIEVDITPTYSGCPAMGMIDSEIHLLLKSLGFENVQIKQILDPAWTTDWMSEEAKKKLNDYGIAPPRLSSEKQVVACPQCGSENSQLISQFSSTSCKAMYKCIDCLEPFEYFKCL